MPFAPSIDSGQTQTLSPSTNQPFVLSLSKDAAGLLRTSMSKGAGHVRSSLWGVQKSKQEATGNMSFWVYILRCADNSYYTGHTDNLEQRIAEHQACGIEGYTSTRLPVRLLFSEEFPTREEALACERQIKGWTRRKKEALMRGDWAEVSRLARRGHPSRASG